MDGRGTFMGGLEGSLSGPERLTVGVESSVGGLGRRMGGLEWPMEGHESSMQGLEVWMVGWRSSMGGRRWRMGTRKCSISAGRVSVRGECAARRLVTWCRGRRAVRIPFIEDVGEQGGDGRKATSR